MAVRGAGGRRVAAAVGTIAMLVVAFLDAVMASPASATVPGVTIDARVDDRKVGDSSETRPIRLSPKRSALLVVEVTNNSNRPIDVRIVRLEGKVVGLTFFAYDTAVALTVAPGQKGSRRFPLDLGGLDGQATGLIPGSVKLLDPDRHVVAEETGVVDVRGSLLSVYGLFGIGVAILTVVSFLGALIGLARHRLPPNRWRRALRFMTPGIGLGLLINFTLSATRVFVPGVGRWLTIMVVSGAVFFALGYVTPTPVLEEEEEEEEEPLALPPTPDAPELASPVQAEIEPPAPQPELPAPEEPPALAAIEEPPALEEPPPASDEPEPAPAPVDEAPPAAADEPPPVDEPAVDEPALATAPAPPTVVVATAAVADGVAPVVASPRLPIVVPCHLPPAPQVGAEETSMAGPWPAAPQPPPPAPPTVVVPTEEA